MKPKYLIVAACSFIALAGCKKSWLDVNTNPNALPSSTADYTFAAAANRVAATLGPNELGSYWSGQWTQSSTYIISNTIFAYQFANTNFNYYDGYYDILEDLQYSIDNAPTSVPFFGGAARVLKAYVCQQLVDLYGNVPYTDALHGTKALAPKFDDQKAIYEDLIKTLDTAITVLKANPLAAAFAGSDFIFGGQAGVTALTPATAPTKWIQFANSLKLRILIRQSRISGRDPYIIAEINKAAAVTEGFLPVGLDVTGNPGYVASAGKLNPVYETWGYNAAGGAQALARYPRPTTFLFNTLIATKDTFRLKRLAYPKGGEGVNPEIIANYVGVPFGAASGYLSQNTSYIGPSQFKKGEYGRPMIFMTNAEVQFLLAEAKQRYGGSVTLPLTAQAYYEQGVKESFRITGTTAAYGAATATTLLTSGIDLADWTASPDKLKAIWMQKWIALTNYNGLEAWSEFRRTNFPVTPASLSTAASQPLPKRLFYPQSELAANGANILAQGTIDVFTTRIFWDVD